MKGSFILFVIMVSGLLGVSAQQPPVDPNNPQQPIMDPNNPGEIPEPGEAPVAPPPEAGSNPNMEGAPPQNPNSAGEPGQSNQIPPNYHDPSNPGEYPEPGEARVPQTNTNTNTGQQGGSTGGANNPMESAAGQMWRPTANTGGSGGQTGNTAGKPPFHDPTNPGEYAEVPEPGEGPVPAGNNQTNKQGINNPNVFNNFGRTNQNIAQTGGVHSALLDALQIPKSNRNFLQQPNTQNRPASTTGTKGKFSAFFKALQKSNTGKPSANMKPKNGTNTNVGQANSIIPKAHIKTVATEMARILMQELAQQGNNLLNLQRNPNPNLGPSRFNGNNGNPSPLTMNIPPLHRKFSYMLDVLAEMRAAVRKAGTNKNVGSIKPVGLTLNNNVPKANFNQPGGKFPAGRNTSKVPEWMKRISGLQMNPSMVSIKSQQNPMTFGNKMSAFNNVKQSKTNPTKPLFNTPFSTKSTLQKKPNAVSFKNQQNSMPFGNKQTTFNKVSQAKLNAAKQIFNKHFKSNTGWPMKPKFIPTQSQPFGNKPMTFNKAKQAKKSSPNPTFKNQPSTPFGNFQNAKFPFLSKKNFLAQFASNKNMRLPKRGTVPQQNRRPKPSPNNVPIPPPNSRSVPPSNIGPSVGPRPQLPKTSPRNFNKPFFNNVKPPILPATKNNAQVPYKTQQFMFNQFKNSNFKRQMPFPFKNRPPQFNNFQQPPGTAPKKAQQLPMTMKNQSSKPATAKKSPPQNPMFQLYGQNANTGLQGLKALISKMTPPVGPVGPK